MNEFNISKLVIYPIKGMQGIEVQEAIAQERGFKNDRRFMLVDENGKFLSQREHSAFIKFKVKIDAGMIIVSYETEELTIEIDNDQGVFTPVQVWDHHFDGLEIEGSHHEWFSDMLGIKCRLVKMNQEVIRKKKLLKAPDSTLVSFADGYPYLVLGTGSLNHLNGKLEKPIDINRFRANIIIDTDSAHVEDELDQVLMGTVPFRMVKPCARCIVTTIDQKSGNKSAEPLKTLANYRKKANKIYFGMNAVCLESGTIKVGQKVKEPTL